jgi:cytochrome P450
VLHGLPVPAGTRVTSYLTAANRDQTGYPDPYAVNFHRPDNAHASFGLGAHRCLGSHLARLEMRLVYEEWHKRFPDYRIAPGQTPRVTRPRGTIGLESLHLRFERDDAS